MKKLIKCIGFPILAGGFIVTLQLHKQSESAQDLMLANIEALSSGDEGEDDPFADCPREKYIRNEKETWKSVTAQYETGVGVYITIKGKKVKLGAGVTVGATVFYPDCVYSKDNCCEKTHINKPFKYA